ncbi:MAG: ATP phosphoribosyltransferase regulatory subunit [Dethiobacter sp.]|nr:ATP phosphoribosyltransferase regulatory subunit [Dethiobacter sp.]
MNEKLRRLLTPEGVHDLLPALAGSKRTVENLMQEIFLRFGYREVVTPAFEYSASFTAGSADSLEEQMYRFPDERGRTLVLRPDFTVPLARLAATHLAGEPKPLRLCYSGSIYRYTSGRQGRQREVAQAGVELIGANCAGSDAETVALAVTVLRELGMEQFTICLGHVGFLQALLNAHGIEGRAGEQAKHYLNSKDFVSLQEMVHALPLPAFSKECLLRVPALRGGQEVLREAERLLPGERGESALAALREVCQILDDYGMTRFVSLDLGLVRDMDYYTGMVFEGYTAGLGFPLCGGGRYDRLLGHFGPDLPAVGFALNTDHLLTVLQRLKKLPNGQELVFVGYDEANRATAFARAEELRRQGAAVIVDVKARDKAETGREGKRLGAAVTHYYG